MTEIQTGCVIAGYTVLGTCGRGAYGEVFRVSDSLGTELALKLLPPGKGAEREIDALIRFRACRHPNLLTVLHIGKLPGERYFYTMDLADPRSDAPGDYQPDTLAARLATGQPFAPDEAERILRELLSGLNELHRTHLLHRDIKPSNILFIRGRAVLADIGLVTNDAGASLIGTPDYMPPELLKNHRPMAPADDCYALGLVLYGMLTGEPPNRFSSVPKTLHDPAALHLLKIAEKACTSPGFPDASAFLEQLNRPVRAGKKYDQWKWAVMGSALLAALAAFAVWRFVADDMTEEPPSPEQVVDSPRKYQMGSSPDAQISEEPVPSAPAPVTYAPEVVAMLKKYQLTATEEAEQKRHMLPYLGLDSERAKQTRRDIVAVTGTTAEADRIFEQEMEVMSLLEKIGSDVPPPAVRDRLDRALQRRKQMYSSKKP